MGGYRLAYVSQREQPSDRALRRSQEIRMQLGGSGRMARVVMSAREHSHIVRNEVLVVKNNVEK